MVVSRLTWQQTIEGDVQNSVAKSMPTAGSDERAVLQGQGEGTGHEEGQVRPRRDGVRLRL